MRKQLGDMAVLRSREEGGDIGGENRCWLLPGDAVGAMPPYILLKLDFEVKRR